MRVARLVTSGAILGAGVLAAVFGGSAQPAPPRLSMEQLHQHGGTPPGWKFSLPAGDPRAGREVFAKLECGKCHEVKGEHVHGGPRPADATGPELSGMGSRHPAEYFAESILDPNAVIVTGPGFTGPDGRSTMPDYREVLGVKELVDLVAYLKSLTGGAASADAHAGPAAQEQVAASYRVRLAYRPHGHAATGAGDHGHGSPGGAAPAPGAQPHGGPGSGTSAHGHLMVFVTDVHSGEPLPYLPVSATVVQGRRAQTLRLSPMLGDEGFHYGADVALADATSRITISIGPPALRLLPPVAGRFGGSQTFSFEWSTGPAAR
ncbi:MAG: iron transporter [Candidatus Rokuibacteriota bacterium]